MITQKITFQDSNWINLVGVLSRPVDWYGMPVVIACHGFSSNKDRSTYMTLEKNLVANNIAIFRFDFFGHGESDGDFADIELSKAVDGTLQAYELMQKKWFTKIGLFGSSFGWCTALNVASILNEDLFCLVCKCPVSDYAKQKEESQWIEWMKQYKEQWYYMYESWSLWMLKVKYWFYEDMAKNNVHEKAQNITLPTLIVHGDADVTVKVEQSIKTAEMMPNCTLEIIEWSWHWFDQPEDAFTRINDLFLKFFLKHA